MSVDQSSDNKAPATFKRRKRGKFVGLDLTAPIDLRFWLDLHLESSKAKKEGARRLLLDLLHFVDFRTNEVRGSDRRLAAALGLARDTFRDYVMVLGDMGLLERCGTASNADTSEDAGWRIPGDVAAWLQAEGPVPRHMWEPFLLLIDPQERVDFVTRMGGAGSEQDAPVDGTLGHGGRHLGPLVDDTLGHGGPHSGPPHAASPAETPALDVQTSQTQTGGPSSLVEDTLGRLAAITGCAETATAANVRAQVERLMPGWSPDEIAKAFGPKYAKAKAAPAGVASPVGWTAAVLAGFDAVSPRAAADAERADHLQRQSAGPCEHGHPSGTARNTHDLSPCIECNGHAIRERRA
jgi:hypothetical protein